VWSTLAGPMQEVAAYAFAEPPELVAYLADCNRLHGLIARAVHSQLVAAGASCRHPTGGFYVYPDLEPLRECLLQHEITDSASLQRHLLDQFNIAVLAGHDLGDDANALRFKMSTGQLYGTSEEEQVRALYTSDPTQLPHIVNALTRIEEALTKLRT
jgi:aspartate aminotransferase